MENFVTNRGKPGLLYDGIESIEKQKHREHGEYL